MPLAGLSIFKASIAQAGATAGPADEAERLLELVSKSPHVSEAVTLVTCERIEIYMVVERFHDSIADACEAVAICFDAPLGAVVENSAERHDEGVVRHLFEVASGLDSKVLGETEILGQVARAWELAREKQTSRRYLNDLLRHAVVTGKRTRSETAFGTGVRTIGSAALNLARIRNADDVLVVGTGDAAISAAHAASRLNPGKLTIVGRSLEKASALADRVGAGAQELSTLEDSVAGADVVVTATSATTPLIDLSSVEDLAKPMTLIDLGDPPNIDLRVESGPDLTVFRLDDVRTAMQISTNHKLEDFDEVRAIVEQECRRYLRNFEERGIDPLIVDLRGRVENIRSQELERFSRRLRSLDPDQRRAVEELTGAIAAKFVHMPIAGLKAAAGTPEAQHVVNSARKMFDL